MTYINFLFLQFFTALWVAYVVTGIIALTDDYRYDCPSPADPKQLIERRHVTEAISHATQDWTTETVPGGVRYAVWKSPIFGIAGDESSAVELHLTRGSLNLAEFQSAMTGYEEQCCDKFFSDLVSASDCRPGSINYRRGVTKFILVIVPVSGAAPIPIAMRSKGTSQHKGSMVIEMEHNCPETADPSKHIDPQHVDYGIGQVAHDWTPNSKAAAPWTSQLQASVEFHLLTGNAGVTDIKNLVKFYKEKCCRQSFQGEYCLPGSVTQSRSDHRSATIMLEVRKKAFHGAVPPLPIHIPKPRPKQTPKQTSKQHAKFLPGRLEQNCLEPSNPSEHISSQHLEVGIGDIKTIYSNLQPPRLNPGWKSQMYESSVEFHLVRGKLGRIMFERAVECYKAHCCNQPYVSGSSYCWTGTITQFSSSSSNLKHFILVISTVSPSTTPSSPMETNMEQGSQPSLPHRKRPQEQSESPRPFKKPKVFEGS
ncbi:unnamed protein product [Calypogeia fissa]